MAKYTGPERREHCALHDLLWDKHDEERDEARQRVCDKIAKLHDAAKSATSWRVFLWASALFVSMIAWIYVDHFRLSNQVSFNTGIIQQIDAKLDSQLKSTKLFLDRQEKIMEQMGIAK